MTGMTNINIMKGKVTMVVLAFFLALLVAASVQTRAEAATEPQVSTSPIEDAKPAGTDMATLPGQALKASPQPKTDSPKGAISTRSTTTGVSGRPGYLELYPIQAYANYGGYQYLTGAGANIYRSPSYSGDQVISISTTIYKRDVVNGTYSSWIVWANPTYTQYVRPGQIAQMPSEWFYHSDLSSNEYYADVTVQWRAPNMTLLASQKVRLGNSWDYQCMSSAGCYKVGQEGQVRLSLSFRSTAY
jgi:hypothetical protein